jgi:mannitol/fructose-specific phosphotransferase system IIA component (Ntr-type)
VAGTQLVDLAPYVDPDRVIHFSGTPSKREVLTRLAERTVAHPSIKDAKAFMKAIFDREEVTSTGIGGGVAIPHARLSTIRGFVISMGLSPQGLDFIAQDGVPVRIVVMIAGSEQDRQTYLRVLATVAARLKNAALCKALLEAKDDEQVLARFLAYP